MSILFNDRIGSVIKKLAISIFIVEVFAGFVSGIVYAINEAETIFIGFLAILLFTLGGFIVGYLSSIFIYAFGVIVDKLVKIEQKIDKGDASTTEQTIIDHSKAEAKPIVEEKPKSKAEPIPIVEDKPKSKAEPIPIETLKNMKIFELNSLFLKGLISRDEYNEASLHIKGKK